MKQTNLGLVVVLTLVALSLGFVAMMIAGVSVELLFRYLGS